MDGSIEQTLPSALRDLPVAWVLLDVRDETRVEDGFAVVPGMALVHFRTEGEITPNPKLLCDDRLATDGIRASGRQHPVQHRHADGSLGLLSRKAAGSQPWTDQRFVTTHCRFY